MSNPNSFGNSNEIDGQVGMNEWMESNASQEVSSRVGGNLRTISQAQSLELLDSFENEIKEAEGKLNDLDRMRRSREFEMMRDAITARRAELTPNNVTEAVSEDISISNEDINDASVDVAETSNYGGIDDRTLADIATSPDVGEESRAAAMREVERRETEGTFDIDNPVYKEGEWSDFDGISDDELLDMATSPDVDPRLSEAAEAELKRRETEAGNDEIVESGSNEDVGSRDVGELADVDIEAHDESIVEPNPVVRTPIRRNSDGKVVGYARVSSDEGNSETSAESNINNEQYIGNVDTLGDVDEKINTLEARQREVAEARRQAKEAGDYQQEAFYNSQYADIVAEINELKNGSSEESAETQKDNSEEIAKLEKRLQEVAHLLDEAKRNGDYEHEALYRAQFSRIVEQIYDLEKNAESGSDKDGSTFVKEEESVGIENESAEKDNDREERIKRNKEIFENALHKINECTDLDKLASWRKKLEEGFAKLDSAVQKKTLERYKEIIQAIDDRMEAPELNLRKYRAWQTGQMMEYKDLSDKDREDFKKKIAKEEDFSGMNWDNDILINGFRTKESDHEAKTGEGSSTENNTDSGEASEDGVNKVPFEEYYLAELEDEYVDELLSHPDYTMQGGIRDRYIRMFKELGDSFYAFVAKLNASNLDADAKKNKLDEYRSTIAEKISDIREKYESEMRGLAGKINALGREVSFGIMNNSDDKNEASAARKGALEEFDSFFAEDGSEAADDSDESEESSDNLDDDKEDSDNFVKKVDVLLNPDSFYKSDEGLRALFTGSRSYYDAIETLESAYLEGKTFDEVSSILDTVLSERGEEGKSRVLRKRLKRRYETLGINEDGTLNSEKSEKVSWRKRAANAIRKALKMEVE